MIDRREAAHQAILLAGSAILLGFSISLLPPDVALLQAPATPLDRVGAAAYAPAYRLLVAAASILPPDSSVAALSEPRDAARETSLHRMAVALLPGRRIFPAALWNVATPDLLQQADFLVVAGAKPSPPPGKLLLETPWGSVWKRSRP